MALLRDTVVDDMADFASYHIIIKVFKDDGKKYADVEIPYTEGDTIGDIRGRAVRPDGMQVPFTGQVFERAVVRSRKLKVQVKSFTLAGVEVGSVLEYSYTRHWKGSVSKVLKDNTNSVISANSFPTAKWRIDDGLFTRESHFLLRPAKGRPVDWAVTPSTVLSTYKPVVTGDGSLRIDLKDVPAFEDEEYSPPSALIRPEVNFFYVLGSAHEPQAFWYEYGKFAGTWYVDQFVGHSKDIEKVVQQLVLPSDSAEAKLRKLYARAQQVRYLSFEAARSEKELKKEGLKENKSADDVMKRNYAFANEINLFFVAMARAAGFRARILLLTSRDDNVFKAFVLDTAQLNAQIVGVTVDGVEKYFDPATRYCPFDLVPWEESGVSALAADSGGGLFVNIPGDTTPAALERTGKFQVDKDGSLEGDLTVRFKGQSALDERRDANELDATGRHKKLEDTIKDWLPAGAVLENLKMDNWEKHEEPLVVETHLKVPHFASLTSKRLIFPAAAFHTNRKRVFENATRKYPVYFRFPQWEEDTITYLLPDGFKVEVSPTLQSATAPESNFEFGTVVMSDLEGNDKEVKLHRRFEMKNFFYLADQYPALRDFYGKVATRDQEKVVLRAAAPVAAAK